MDNVASPKDQLEKPHEESTNNKDEEIELYEVESRDGPMPKIVNDILLINDAEGAVSSNSKTTKKSKFYVRTKDIYGFTNRGLQNFWVFRMNTDRSEDIPDRALFLIKTFFVLIVCLSVTIYITWHAFNTPPFGKHFDQKTTDSKFFVYFAIAAYITILFTLVFTQCPTVEPNSLIITVLSVLSFSVFVILAVIQFRKKEIVYAQLATCLVVCGCLILATLEYDFTKWYTYFIVFGFAVLATVIIYVIAFKKFGERYTMTRMMWGFLWTTYYCVCITVQMQLILLRKSIVMDETHYIVAAVLLYMSVAVVLVEAVRYIMTYIQDDIRRR